MHLMKLMRFANEAAKSVFICCMRASYCTYSVCFVVLFCTPILHACRFYNHRGTVCQEIHLYIGTAWHAKDLVTRPAVLGQQ